MLMISHFSAVLLFATFASVVFGITQRTSPRAMIRYGTYCWVMFVGIVIAASWIMWFIRR
jgi:hypothetical protein